jgi:hypothetical protein
MLEMFGLLFLGLIFTVVGYGAEVKWLFLIGLLIMPLALLWGALFRAEDDIRIKITLLAIAGIIIAAIILSFSPLAFGIY